MPKLGKIPKNCLWLEANSLEDFQNTKDLWQRNNWLLGADYANGMYSAIGMKDYQVMVILFKEIKVSG